MYSPNTIQDWRNILRLKINMIFFPQYVYKTNTNTAMLFISIWIPNCNKNKQIFKHTHHAKKEQLLDRENVQVQVILSVTIICIFWQYATKHSKLITAHYNETNWQKATLCETVVHKYHRIWHFKQSQIIKV